MEKSKEDMNEVMDRKTSFDRFGDDLSQLIVSYLTIEDKFRFQCLNRQWLRMVFEEEYVLRVERNNKTMVNEFRGDYSVKPQVFEKCLLKLKNLTEIQIDLHIDNTEEVLQIIADNCHHLRRLSIGLSDDISDESIEYFGQKCGQKLKNLSIENLPYSLG